MDVSWVIQVAGVLPGGRQGGSVPERIHKEKREEDVGMLSLEEEEEEERPEPWDTADPHLLRKAQQ